MSENPARRIRSFVLRQGRLTRAQELALGTQWSTYGIDYSDGVLDLAALFGHTGELTVEIGFGNGESLVQQAQDAPSQNHIGIEVHRPGVGHCLHRIAELGLTNLKLINHDAVEVLMHQIPAASLSKVQLFFPDPWQKKRHHKRRIFQQSFIDLIRDRLLENGHLHLATDWEDYAEHMQREIAERDEFELVSTDRGDRPMTKFEQRGLRLGHGVWDFVYRRT